VPLYEIVLRSPDRDEIRLTDRNGDHHGQEVVIAGRRFLVTGREQAQAASVRGRLRARTARLVPRAAPSHPLAAFGRQPAREGVVHAVVV
jgi:hypothetical protein